MINDNTDVYAIMKREFPEDVKYLGLSDNKELASFLYYNAHNEMFLGTDEYYYHNVNFRNLDTGVESRMFEEGEIYFFPKNNDLVSTGNEMKAFKIGRGAKCINVNSNGLFIEKTDLERNISTQFYDSYALAEISEKDYSAGNIDYIEHYIEEMGIKPDRIISVDKKDNNLLLSITENGEVVRKGQAPADENRTLYSTYYEFMKANNYYGQSSQQHQPNNRIHR